MVIFLHFLLANIGNVACNPTVYDQRQSGKTNVRVDVKDAVVIAIGDGEFGGDYDYNYDYSDLTVKPIMPVSSTSAPLSSTTPPKSTTVKSTTVLSTSPSSYNITQNAAVVLEAENNSIIFPASGLKPGNGSTSAIKIPPHSYKPDQIPVLVLQETPKPHKFLPVRTVEKQYLSSSQIRGKASNSSSVNPEDLPPRHCSPGFFLDNHNRCKRIRRERPQLPFGLRFDHRPLTRS